MLKTIIATAIALTSLTIIALPAQAAAGGITCDAGASIAGHEDAISQELTAMGYAVDAVEEWNNCVRAFVVKAVARPDPRSGTRPIESPPGQARG